MIEQGASLDGYRVERMLGFGGMGIVYEATQDSLGRKVALKVLRPELAADPDFVARFRREGQLQASLEHPHVLDVYEVGESPHGLFMAMRLVEGDTLAGLLRDGLLTGASTLDLLGQVGDALDAAHGVGLLHRDVKPQNVLVAAEGTAYLADFGLTRAGETTTVAASSPLLGTVAYVAPEVVRGEDAGPASDRYAFAAALFHCLTGDVVYPRGSDAAVLFAHASEPPPVASERRPELPSVIDEIFEEALAKDPERRPLEARILVEGVRDALGDRAGTLGPPSAPTVRPASFAVPPAHLNGAPKRSTASRPRALLAAVAVGACAIGAGAVALAGSGDEAAPAPEAPIPELSPGAVALGSTLPVPDRSVDCRGNESGGSSPACSVAQTELPGAQLLAPADGRITSWVVRGASGDIALDILRPRGDETVRVSRSQWETAGNEAPHEFATDLPVERGDLIAIQLGPGATIGVNGAEGATTDRWFSPGGGLYGAADRGAGTGFDSEVLLRAEFAEGEDVELPPELTGPRAAKAPDGNVRRSKEVRISDPRSSVTVELVEVGDRVALDLIHGERREVRVYMPDLVPLGVPIELKTFTYEGEPYSEAGVWWVNPNSGRAIFHFFQVTRRNLDFLG